MSYWDKNTSATLLCGLKDNINAHSNLNEEPRETCINNKLVSYLCNRTFLNAFLLLDSVYS